MSSETHTENIEETKNEENKSEKSVKLAQDQNHQMSKNMPKKSMFFGF